MLQELIGLALVLIGVFFAIVGVIGFVRLPDVYSRIHATGKVATLGIIGILAGTAVMMPNLVLKAIALILFLLIASPVASHAIAGAAHKQGVSRVGAARDDLGPAASIEPDIRF